MVVVVSLIVAVSLVVIVSLISLVVIDSLVSVVVVVSLFRGRQVRLPGYHGNRPVTSKILIFL